MDTNEQIKEKLLSDSSIIKIDAMVGDCYETITQYAVNRLLWENDHNLLLIFPNYVYRDRFISQLRTYDQLTQDMSEEILSDGSIAYLVEFKNNKLSVTYSNSADDYYDYENLSEMIIFSERHNLDEDQNTVNNVDNSARVVVIADSTVLEEILPSEDSESMEDLDEDYPDDELSYALKSIADRRNKYKVMFDLESYEDENYI